MVRSKRQATKTKGKGVASSSSQPQEDPHQSNDISSDYGAPFPIYNTIEGTRYVDLKIRSLNGTKFMPMSLVEKIGLKDDYVKILKVSGLTKIMNNVDDAYVELCEEFYTTLKISDEDNKKLEFRLLGERYLLCYDMMHALFGFPNKGIGEKPSDFKVDTFWTSLTDCPNYVSRQALAKYIKDHKYWLLHRVMASVVMGKSDPSRVSEREVWLLYNVHNKKKINWTYFIFNQMLTCAGTDMNTILLGHLVTIFAKYVGLDESSFNGMHKVRSSNFTAAVLIRGEVIDRSFSLVSAHARSVWKGRDDQQGDEEDRDVEEEVFASEDDDDHDDGDDDTQEGGDAFRIAPRTHVGGSSQTQFGGDQTPIWQQVLDQQRAMAQQQQEMSQQLQTLTSRVQANERMTRRLNYKIDQYFSWEGLNFPSPPPPDQD